MHDENEVQILIIDDNPSVHKDFEKILCEAKISKSFLAIDEKLFGKQTKAMKEYIPSYKLSSAFQGEEVVEIINQARAKNTRYAMAFVDIRMPPGWDGVETIKHMWELDPDIQVVICTAYSDYTWEETIEELGTGDKLLILKKPFDNVVVRQLAFVMTRKWQLLQENKQYINNLEKTVQSRTQSLQQSLSTMYATFESTADGIIVISNDGKIKDYNHKFTTMWEISENIIQAISCHDLLNYILSKLKTNDRFGKVIQEIEEDASKIVSDQIALKNDKIFEYYTQPQKIKNIIIGRVWSFSDITKRVLLQKQLEYEATHDLMTGLPNRILLIDRINKAIQNSRRSHKLFAVLYFDLDRFKFVNDYLTHEAGDKVIVEIANRLKSNLRAKDTLARLGGDEYIVVIEDLQNLNYVIKIANKLLHAISIPIKIFGHKITITSSLGIASYPQDGKNHEEIIRNADIAMYYAKSISLDTFKLYDDIKDKKQRIWHFDLESDMRQAITKNQLLLCFQPQVNLNNGKVIALEALIRWRHPKRGILMPDEFVPIAENIGLMKFIGKWVLQNACELAISLRDKGLSEIVIGVNISSSQANADNFVSTVLSILKAKKIQPKQLELELTENMIINNINVIDKLEKLYNLGIRLAFDDFGTAHSSLTNLRIVKVNKLKIDKSFVRNIGVNQQDESIIQAILSMAKSFNLEVVAEGIETKKQAQFLIELGCQYGQGFYFSKPLDKDAIIKYLKKKLEYHEYS